MTNKDVPFREWFAHLEQVASMYNGNCADMEAWEDPYARGLTPEQAWQEEWGDQQWETI